MDRIDNCIAQMRRMKQTSNIKPKLETPKLVIKNDFKERFGLIGDKDFNRILTIIKSDELPTLENVEEEIMNGLYHILSYHNHNNGCLSHDCCFTDYYPYIKKLIKIILSKEHLYSRL